jgi:Uma2 family endonuclease
LIVRPFETEARDRKTESVVSLLEHAPRLRKSCRQRLAHTRRLRTLSGEKKCCFGGQTRIIAEWYGMDMSVGTLLSVEEYLNTSYSPDMEYRDGVLVERNVGDEAHSLLQLALGTYLHQHRKQWNIKAYTELRIKVREKWFPIPDLCVYPRPGFKGRYPDFPPLLWIEILSEDDRIADVWKNVNELIANGVAYVWVIDPITLASELRTASGVQMIADKTLRLPNSLIVVPLLDVMED